MKILTRNDWRAISCTEPRTFAEMKDRTEFVVHHTAGPSGQTVAAIQRFHIEQRGWSDIGYNFLVRGTTGEVYEGRGWNAVGAHVQGRNRQGLGVAIIGTDLLEEPAKQSLRELYAAAVTYAGHPLMIRGHRDLAATVCPGPKIHKWILSGALETHHHRILAVQIPYQVGPDVRHVQSLVGADVDGIYGPDTRDDVALWQMAQGLAPDGVVGPKTWVALDKIE